MSPFSSVAEVTVYCRQNGLWLMPSVNGLAYPVDEHWRIIVLVDIQTVKAAEAFLGALGSGCTKARVIRHYLDGPRGEFWRATPERIRSAIACNRRVGCSCHETGSFAKKPAGGALC